MRRIAPHLAVALTFVVFAVSGCGGSDDGGSSTSATPSTVDPAVAQRDQAIADDALVRLDDLPNGWTAEDQDDDAGDDSVQTCSGLTVMKQNNARAESARFSNDSNDSFFHAVAVFPTQAGPASGIAGLRARETRDCIAEKVKKQLEKSAGDEGFDVGDVETGELQVTKAGDDTAAMRLTVPLEKDGLNVDATYDLVMTQIGRGASLLIFASVLTAFDQEMEDEMVSLAADRLSSALA